MAWIANYGLVFSSQARKELKIQTANVPLPHPLHIHTQAGTHAHSHIHKVLALKTDFIILSICFY